MTYEQFSKTLSLENPPDNISPYLQSLWFDAKNNWEKAHTMVQDLQDNNAAWIHAYLHRKEGDTGNADYWYRRAGKKRPDVTLAEEWEDIVMTLIRH